MPSYTSNYGQVSVSKTPYFNMIDNYIYLHHINQLIILPTFPESISDNHSVAFQSTPILGRSAPIYTYSGSGPREVMIKLQLHRDMMQQINTSKNSAVNLNLGTELFSGDAELMKKLQREDYVDLMINELQAIALPSYAASEKMINPPMVSVRFGDEIFCKGVVTGSVSVNYSGPILANRIYDSEGNIQYSDKAKTKPAIGKGKYALVDISFTVSEVDPYDALTVAKVGSMRGLNRTLERNLYKGV